MEANEFAAMSNEALLQELKKAKSTTLFDALIIGFMAGIAVYSSVRNGFGLLTFLPLIYLPIAARNKVKRKALELVLRERDLR